MIKKVVLAIRQKNLLCPPPTRTSLTLLGAPYFFITCCICQLYHTAKQPLFVRTSRTREWTNKRPGASSWAKIKCNTWEMREKYAFFSLAIHVPKLSSFARKSHEGALKKKKDYNEKTLTVWSLLPCLHTQGVGICTPLTTVVPGLHIVPVI